MFDLDKIRSHVESLSTKVFSKVYLADDDRSKVVYHLYANTELFELSFHEDNGEQNVMLRSVPRRLMKGSQFREIFYGKFDSCSWNRMTSVLYDNFSDRILA